MNYITTRSGLEDVNETTQQGSEQLDEDVIKRKKANEAARNENSDWLDSAVYPKTQNNSLPKSSESQEKDANCTEGDSSNANYAHSHFKCGE